MNKLINVLIKSPLIKITITLITYFFYAFIIGLSLLPSIYLIIAGINNFIIPIDNIFSLISLKKIIIFSFIAGASIYLYFITGIIIIGIIVRIISFGIKPGKYNAASLTMIRWLIYSGIFMIAVKTILPFTAMTFFAELFFRILGCKIGKNVYINTPNLNDPQFLQIGNNVVIGGLTNISCHTFEGNKLVLGKIKIGSNTLIGTNCYIMPDVTIGNYCNIGMYAYVRKNRIIPDKTYLSALSALPVRKIIKLERGKI